MKGEHRRSQMKVAHANITPLVNQAYTNLEILQAKIGENVSSVNDKELSDLIVKLQHEANQITREVNQSIDVTPLDSILQMKLVKLMDMIQHTSTFSQVLGNQQALLLGVFRRIRNCLKHLDKFKPKVTKADTEPLL